MRRVRRMAGIAGATAALLLVASTGAVADEATKRLYVLGDSLTAGYGLPEEDGFTRQLERALRAAGHDVRVIDGGVSGDTTAGGRARIEWALGDDPHYAIVELGANDGLRGLDPARTRENLDAILAAFGERGIPVLLAGMYAPPNLGKRYEEEFNAVFPDLAEKHGAVFYPFFLEGVAAERELNQPDGIHPNAEGVAVIVRNILPHVEKLLDQPAADGD